MMVVCAGCLNYLSFTLGLENKTQTSGFNGATDRKDGQFERVAELAYAPDLKFGAFGLVGSYPTALTKRS